MDIDVIKEFSTSVKFGSQKEIPSLIKEYFGKMKNEKLLGDLLTFVDKFPMYRKLMTLVVKHIKPSLFCVYILKDKGSIVYVGKSTDVCVRLNSHAKDKEFDEVFIIETEDKRSQDFCENSLILKYKPKYNKSLNIKMTSNVVNFDKEAVNFAGWLQQAEWFSGISPNLQSKLSNKFTLKDFNSFVDRDYSINFKTKTSFVLLESPEEVREQKSYITIKSRLQKAAMDYNKPELFSVVTDGMYKFGKFYISGKGKWRVEGGKTWYFNVDIDKIVRDTVESFNVVDIDVPTLECVPIWFGKYRGKLFSEVKEIDPTYCEWVLKTFKQSELIRLGAI